GEKQRRLAGAGTTDDAQRAGVVLEGPPRGRLPHRLKRRDARAPDEQGCARVIGNLRSGHATIRPRTTDSSRSGDDRGMDDGTVERVRAAVRAIRPRQVRSYGEVAEEVGLRSARLVGRVLAVDGHDLPWHRVVRADGSFAPHLAAEQAARLRVEGV